MTTFHFSLLVVLMLSGCASMFPGPCVATDTVCRLDRMEAQARYHRMCVAVHGADAVNCR